MRACYSSDGEGSLRSHRHKPAAARLLRSWVRIPPVAWIFVYCECCVFSDRGLCDELITRPEESYRLGCVVVCDLETSRMGAPYICDISRLRVKHVDVILIQECFRNKTDNMQSYKYEIVYKKELIKCA